MLRVESAVGNRLRRILEEHLPGSELLRFWNLEGGISATMTAFEVRTLEGGTRRLIARQPNDYRFKEASDAAQQEFRVLQALHRAGLPVQKPLFSEAACDEVPHPFFVIEYIDGSPDISPSDRGDYLQRYCDELVQIHAVDFAVLELDFLPRQDKGYGKRPEKPNHTLREGEIRDALESMSPHTCSNSLVLRHGDFWPGNVLWRDGKIVGVIDWEECLIGEPLADLAICRLDLWWVFGEEAAYEFTDLFRASTQLDLTDLPYWDLCASLRPIRNIEDWAPSYPQLGRPDITAETLMRDHQAFVAQALATF